MTTGLLALASGKGTNENHLVGFLLAQRVNMAAGGAVVSPWDIDDLPDVWLDAAKALTGDLAEIQDGQRQVNDRLTRWRAEHRRKNG